MTFTILEGLCADDTLSEREAPQKPPITADTPNDSNDKNEKSPSAMEPRHATPLTQSPENARAATRRIEAVDDVAWGEAAPESHPGMAPAPAAPSALGVGQTPAEVAFGEQGTGDDSVRDGLSR